jgi:hypothetical protein
MRAACVVLCLSACCWAQSAPQAGTPATGAEIRFDFERVGLPVPKFTLTIHEDGTGTYQAQTAAVSGGAFGQGATAAQPPMSRPVHISTETTETIFKTARALDRFNIECASKLKNIADTGKKVLGYNGPDGHGTCQYNYSDNKSITQLTATFQAIAFTMDEGRKLEFLHRFDRLGLYSEIDALDREVAEKRALELENIAPALKSIVADEELIQKVREHAAKLLAQTEAQR